jgi:uncharacterized protein YutE (UPF0331/DUF86 family)
VLDRERILTKLDELQGYLRELNEVVPAAFEDCLRVETKRASERIFQLSIECVIDVCSMLVSGLRLGLPGEEDDLFEKLVEAKVLPVEMSPMLRDMKGLRSILVHEYGRIDDRVVFDRLTTGLGDFGTFSDAVAAFLRGREDTP